MIEWGQRKTYELVKNQNVFHVENTGIMKSVFKLSVESKRCILSKLTALVVEQNIGLRSLFQERSISIPVQTAFPEGA